MDAASLAVRLGHRRHRLSDALSAVLIVVVRRRDDRDTDRLAAQIRSSASTIVIDALPGIPLASPVTIQPRVISAYAALLAAAMLSLLYLYRGRAFVVYWIGSWLLDRSAPRAASRADYADTDTAQRADRTRAALHRVGSRD